MICVSGTVPTGTRHLHWSQHNRAEWHCNTPGQPAQSDFFKTLIDGLREESLNDPLFATGAQPISVLAEWLEGYSNTMQHVIVGCLYPAKMDICILFTQDKKLQGSNY